MRNHPFNDGNKRAGTGAALMFLRANGADLEYNVDAYVSLAVEVAKGEAEKPHISRFFQSLKKRKQ